MRTIILVQCINLAYTDSWKQKITHKHDMYDPQRHQTNICMYSRAKMLTPVCVCTWAQFSA
jgi:hypothetical protein